LVFEEFFVESTFKMLEDIPEDWKRLWKWSKSSFVTTATGNDNEVNPKRTKYVNIVHCLTNLKRVNYLQQLNGLPLDSTKEEIRSDQAFSYLSFQ